MNLTHLMNVVRSNKMSVDAYFNLLEKYENEKARLEKELTPKDQITRDRINLLLAPLKHELDEAANEVLRNASLVSTTVGLLAISIEKNQEHTANDDDEHEVTPEGPHDNESTENHKDLTIPVFMPADHDEKDEDKPI